MNLVPWIKPLQKLFAIIELGLWLAFFYIHFYEDKLFNILVLLAMMGLYVLFPVFVFKSRGWKLNLLAFGIGLVMVFGVYAVISKIYGWPWAKDIGLVVFWLALFGAAACFSQTFRAQQRHFFAETCVRLSMITLLTLPFQLGWWS